MATMAMHANTESAQCPRSENCNAMGTVNAGETLATVCVRMATSEQTALLAHAQNGTTECAIIKANAGRLVQLVGHSQLQTIRIPLGSLEMLR